MEPVKQILCLCRELAGNRLPFPIFVYIADKAAQVQRFGSVRSDGQNGVCAFRLYNRTAQIALRQNFRRFFIAPMVQRVLCSLRKALHGAGLKRQRRNPQHDCAGQQKAERRNGAFLPCQQQKGDPGRHEKPRRDVDESRRRGEADKQRGGQSRGLGQKQRQRRQQQAAKRACQPEAGAVGFGQRQQDAFPCRPEAARLIPERAEAVQERRPREAHDCNQGCECGGQQNRPSVKVPCKRKYGQTGKS